MAGDTLVVVTDLLVIGLDAATGAERWRYANSFRGGRPTVSGDRVYVTNKCGPTALDARTGTEIYATPDCFDFGSDALLTGGRVVTRFDGTFAADGGGKFEGPDLAQVGEGFGLIRHEPGRNLLRAVELPRIPFVAVGAPRWSWAPRTLPGGGGALNTMAPAIADGVVWQLASLGSSEDADAVAVALDADSGKRLWAGYVPGLPARPIEEALAPRLAAGDGRLLVALERGLFALRNAPPGSAVLSASVDRRIVRASETATVSGTVSSRRGLVEPRRVRLQRDPYPFGGFSETQTRIVDERGRFSFTSRYARNERIRLESAGQVQRTTVFTLPRIDLEFGTVREDLRVVAEVRIGRAEGLDRSRPVALYALPKEGGLLRRLGRVRLGADGRGSVTISVAGLARNDRILPCLRGAHKDGYGPPDALSRRCGAARLKL